MSSRIEQWLSIATTRPVVVRSTRVALVVGTLLAAINHGDSLLAGSLDGEAALKICLTYLVPYAVATWSAVQTILAGSD